MVVLMVNRPVLLKYPLCFLDLHWHIWLIVLDVLVTVVLKVPVMVRRVGWTILVMLGIDVGMRRELLLIVTSGTVAWDVPTCLSRTRIRLLI